MAIILTQSQKNLLTLIGADSADSFTFGIGLDTSGDGVSDQSVYTETMPLRDWAQIAPIGSLADIKFRSGIESTMVPIVRHMGPIGFQKSQIGPIVNFTGTATLLTYTTRMSVPRVVQITATFNCYTDDFGTTPTNLTRVDYWLEINGVATTAFRQTLPKPVVDITYGYLPSHGTATGTWTVTLPAGVVTIDLKGTRGNGAGKIYIGSENFAAISGIG